MSFYKYDSTSGRRNRKRKTLLCIHHFLFYNNVGFLTLVKVQVYFLSSILRSRKCELLYTRFQASVLSSSMFFVWWRKTSESNVFQSSCGTLIGVRIIPVKVDRSLTGIIRTYIIIEVQRCLICPEYHSGFSPKLLAAFQLSRYRSVRSTSKKLVDCPIVSNIAFGSFQRTKCSPIFQKLNFHMPPRFQLTDF